MVNKTATAAILQLTTNRERQVKFSFFNDQEHRRCHEHFNDVIISLATHLFEMIITHLQLQKSLFNIIVNMEEDLFSRKNS